MSLQRINLRKLLKIMYLEGPRLVTALRADIREDRDRELGSGLVDQSQKMTVAARATAEKKTVGHRS